MVTKIITPTRSATIFMVLFSCAVIAVANATHVAAIARGYTTSDDGLAAGMVAALSESGDSEVERADQNSTDRIVGVVTTSDSSSVTLSSANAKLLVESEGEVSAYVSNINGEVQKGDLVSLSSFKGILMKAKGSSTGGVVGVAAEGGSETTNYSYSENGTVKTTKITKVKINLNKQGATTSTHTEPSPLSKVGQSITGKQVSDIRVLAALIMFVLVMVAEGGIIYGAITSAITALGRNPMARKTIRREMSRVIVVAVGVLGIGLGAVYGVLWY